MINCLKRILRQSSKLYTLLYRLKHGYYWYLFKFYLFHKQKELKKLQELGFTNLKPVSKETWRMGDESDHAERRYYTGIFNGKKVFIKIALNDATVVNEISIHRYLSKYVWSKTPKAVLTKTNFNGDWCLLAIEFYNNLSTIADDVISVDKALMELNAIIDDLYKMNIVHSDIHKGNIMVSSDGELVLLDFGISMIKGIDNNIDYISRPGTFYIEENGYRIYDDVYSAIQMLRGIYIKYDFENNDEYHILLSKLGRFSNIVSRNI